MEAVRLAAATSACLVSILAAAGSGAAHIGVTPGLLVVGNTQTLSLSVHNDLDRPMTGLRVAAPDGIRIGLAGAKDEWQAVIESSTATWTGGPLAPNTGATFELELAVDAATAVGPVQLQAEQLYPGNGSLPWPIPVTVIPGTVTVDASLDPWYISGLLLVGALVLAGVALLAWLKRRRDPSLQEQ